MAVTSALLPETSATEDIECICLPRLMPGPRLHSALTRISDRRILAGGKAVGTLHAYLRSCVALRHATNEARLPVAAATAQLIVTLLACRYGLTGGTLRNYMTALRMMTEDLTGDTWTPSISRKVAKIIAVMEQAHWKGDLRTFR